MGKARLIEAKLLTKGTKFVEFASAVAEVRLDGGFFSAFSAFVKAIRRKEAADGRTFRLGAEKGKNDASQDVKNVKTPPPSVELDGGVLTFINI